MAYIPLNATEETDIPRNRTVNVESLNAFPAPVANIVRIDDSVTAGEDVTYITTKPLDWGTLRLEIPDFGRVTFKSSNPTSNTWTYRGTGTEPFLFGEMARVSVESLLLQSANGGALFDFSTGFLALEKTNIQGFDTLGTLDGMSFQAENTSLLNNGNGLSASNMILMNMAEIELSGQTDDDITINGCLIGLFTGIVGFPGPGLSIFNIESLGPFDSLTIVHGKKPIFFPGTWFNAAGIDQTDPRVDVFINQGVADSQSIASTGFTGGTTPTVLADTSTFVKVAGTYIDGNLERFTSADGVLTHTGLSNNSNRMIGMVQLLLEPGIETDVIEIVLFKNGTEITGSRVQKTLSDVFQTPTSPVFYLAANPFLNVGDTIDVRMRNTSNATNVTATDVKLIGSG